MPPDKITNRSDAERHNNKKSKRQVVTDVLNVNNEKFHSVTVTTY
jgi:hypothetical protein